MEDVIAFALKKWEEVKATYRVKWMHPHQLHVSLYYKRIISFATCILVFRRLTNVCINSYSSFQT